MTASPLFTSQITTVEPLTLRAALDADAEDDVEDGGPSELGLSAIPEKKLRTLAKAESRVFHGYSGDYYYLNRYESEVSVFKDDAPDQYWDESKEDFHYTYAPDYVHYSHASSTYWKLRLVDDPRTEVGSEADGLSVRARPWAGPDTLGTEVRVRLLHADCRPALSDGDDMLCGIVFVAWEAKVYPKDRYAFQPGLTQNGSELAGPVLDVRTIPGGRIAGTRVRMPRKALVTVGSLFGSIDVAVLLKEGELASLVAMAQAPAGAVMVASGWLGADCATGEFQTGAQGGADNLCRYLKARFENQDWFRIQRALGWDTSFTREGRAFEDEQTFMPMVFKDLYGDDVPFAPNVGAHLALVKQADGSWGRCVATSNGHLLWITTDKSGKIKNVNITYRRNVPKEDIQICWSSAEWLEPDREPPEELLDGEIARRTSQAAMRFSDPAFAKQTGCVWEFRNFLSEDAQGNGWGRRWLSGGRALRYILQELDSLAPLGAPTKILARKAGGKGAAPEFSIQPAGFPSAFGACQFASFEAEPRSYAPGEVWTAGLAAQARPGTLEKAAGDPEGYERSPGTDTTGILSARAKGLEHLELEGRSILRIETEFFLKGHPEATAPLYLYVDEGEAGAETPEPSDPIESGDVFKVQAQLLVEFQLTCANPLF